MIFQLFVGILFVVSPFLELYSVDALLCATEEDCTHVLLVKFKHVPREVAPTGLDGGPVVVNHSISVLDFMGLENNVLTLKVWESMHWQDKRLSWSPAMYGVDEVNVPSRLIWQPDVILYNSMEEYKGFPSGDLNAIVRYDGSVTFVPPQITKSSCYYDLSDMTENEQAKCVLKYGSWTMSGGKLDLRTVSSPEILYNLNPRVNMTSITAKRDVITYQCCPETYIDIRYTLSFFAQ